ncbi:MAG: YceI family protein [Candidatus Acidiferrales bacterium]
MFSKTLSATVLLLVAAGLMNAGEKFSVDSDHSTVGFEVGLGGMIKVDGKLDDVDGTILYDEADLTKSSVTALMPLKGIDTGSGQRDKDLQGAQFFDAAHFPYIIFQSERIEKLGSGYVMFGTLTIHGVTKEVSFPFTWSHKKLSDPWQNTRIGFEGRLVLNRRDYGVNGPEFWSKAITENVDILLRISAEIPNMDLFSFPAPQGKKPVGNLLLETINKDGLDAAIRQFKDLKEKKPAEYAFGPGQLNILGYRLMQHGKNREALEFMKLNSEEYPKDANMYDSLADAYMAVGDRENAIANYKKALELNPDISSSIESLRGLAR